MSAGTQIDFRGVSYRTDRRSWRAQITVRGSTIHLGYYDSAEAAARAYDLAARRLLGERAAPNFAAPAADVEQQLRTPRKSLVLQTKRQLQELDLGQLVDQGVLSPEEQVLLERLFLAQPRWSKVEVARDLGVHPNTVSRRAERALRQLGLDR